MAGGAGQTLFLQNQPVASAGEYTIRLNAVAGTGAYGVELTLNASVETEPSTGAANGTTTTAEPINRTR